MKKMLIKTIAWIAVIILLPYGCYKSFQTEIGTAETAEAAIISGLPTNATEIQYYLPGAFGPNRVYEFKTTEEEFIKWVERERSKDPNVGEIEVRGFRMLRYSPSKESLDWVVIDNGLYSSWHYTDQGKYFGFDRSTLKAYFWSHTR
ncbi:hypothetical protein [Cerasicoccus fimbriatus]|uniref:hypothetical protein n=1 Tax=Cerasicoccus fimbriatus TaxID=3014554 RepID=UPI0022B45C6D|nr:hypothetical protein [Cerasicoccus sp. TK19100]